MQFNETYSISILKFWLKSHRSTTDDLNLLKKELFQVQLLSDTIVRERENENKNLLEENNKLKLELEKF